MKKVIITTAVIIAASFSFYLNESRSVSNTIGTLSQSAAYEGILDFGMIGAHRLDIGQADIK